jgi:hypothetical protein
MASKGRRILLQMGIVSLVAVVTLFLFLVLKYETVMAWALGDPRPLILNGIIFVLFLLGTWQLQRAIRYYQMQEDQINEYARRRQEGEWSADILDSLPETSLLATRYRTIRDLFNGGGPVDHGAISSIMMAEESLQQSFPRFVNNVLILTGVFGTVSSLIFALVGAGDVLQAASPDAGMGLLLLGMNTALTTTATAIVCYFFFTFFFHRLTDLQTWVFSQVERASLLYIVPEFSYEADEVNHQTKLLVEDVKTLVREMREGLGGIEAALSKHEPDTAPREDSSEALLAGMDRQNAALEGSLTRLDDLRKVLIDGFRLDGR